MRQVAGEIVGRELVLRVHTFVAQVLGPLGKQRPVGAGIIGVAINFS